MEEIMEVYCKFKSAKDYVSIPIDWHYTTVSDVKEYLLKKKCSGKRNKTHYDILTLINPDTNEEYLDGETLIPKSSFLMVRRSPRCICTPIVINPPQLQDHILVEKEYNPFDEPSTSVFPQESEWVDFWNDLSPAPPSTSKVDKRIGGSRFGRGGGLLDQITPPLGYVCRRCKVPGHFIQYCPTNGDPAFNNIVRTRRPTGIPDSMLMATSDGSYVLPNGDVAVLKPDEAAFDKEIEGIPSTRAVVSLPPELYCPLCKALMKDAVLASKCCFGSFCDKCIREHIMSKSLCTCGATNVLADDLLPNKTLRDTILRMTKSINSSGANGGSAFQPRNMESAPCSQAKISCSKVPSPTLSAPSNGVVVAPKTEGNTEVEEMTEAVEVDNVAQEGIRTSFKRKVKHGDDDYKEEFKKRKLVNSSPSGVYGWSRHRSYNMTSNGHHKDQYRTSADVSKSSYSYADDDTYQLSDADKHLRRRPSRYESSPAPKVVKGRHSSRG